MDAIFDMTTGMEIQQPALFNVFVELPNENDGFEEKKSMYWLIWMLRNISKVIGLVPNTNRLAFLIKLLWYPLK